MHWYCLQNNQCVENCSIKMQNSSKWLRTKFDCNAEIQSCIEYFYPFSFNFNTDFQTSMLKYSLRPLILSAAAAAHYENTPIQIYWKFYNQKRKIFR